MMVNCRQILVNTVPPANPDLDALRCAQFAGTNVIRRKSEEEKKNK